MQYKFEEVTLIGRRWGTRGKKKKNKSFNTYIP
jgi:hypothetical protein